VTAAIHFSIEATLTVLLLLDFSTRHFQVVVENEWQAILFKGLVAIIKN
jgi:hypothetical protein